MKPYETNHLVNNADNIGSAFYLRINTTGMKKKFKLNDKPLSSDELLKKFVKEHFPFSAMVEAGLFTKEMKGDYKAQAEKMRVFFGLESIYEYGKDELRCHVSYAGERPKDEPFITTIPSIYE